MKRNFLTIIVVGALTASAFFIKPTSAQAFSFGDIFNGIKSIFTPSTQPSLTVSSKISLVSSGDLNHNGQIDAGDTVKFTYVIANTTKTTYKLASLKTNIDTKELNGTHDLQGALSLDQSNGTIVIPDLTLTPDQLRTVSFEAQINFYKDADQTIDTTPELVDQQGNPILKGEIQTVKAAKMDTETFDKFAHITK